MLSKLFRKFSSSSIIPHHCILIKKCLSTSTSPQAVDLIYQSYNGIGGDGRAFSPLSPPLLMFHGMYGSKSNFKTFAQIFTKKTTPKRAVLTVDVRNHGYSPHTEDHTYEHMAEDIRMLLQKLNFSKAALFGHSMGGKGVLYFSLKYPNMVDKLIISDVSHVSNLENIEWFFEVFQNLSSLKDVLEKVPTDVPLGKAMEIADQMMADKIKLPWIRRSLATNLRKNEAGTYYWRINIKTLLKDMQKLVTFPDVTGKTIDGPVLFLAGAESNFVKKDDVPAILKLCPKATVKFIDGAGHLIHVDKPEEFANACLEFLNAK